MLTYRVITYYLRSPALLRLDFRWHCCFLIGLAQPIGKYDQYSLPPPDWEQDVRFTRSRIRTTLRFQPLKFSMPK